MTQISDFSSEYYLLDADVVPYGGDEVISGHDLFNGLCYYVADPIVHVGGAHYHLKSEGAVPADTLAVPNDLTHLRDEPVLVAKDGARIPSVDVM